MRMRKIPRMSIAPKLQYYPRYLNIAMKGSVM
jgi:hypothetical protein